MNSRLCVLLLATTVLWIAPDGASADDYCVGSPSGCVGTDEGSDLQQAFTDADNHAGPDRVLIGPGGSPYSRTDGFSYVSGTGGNTVDVTGVGSPAPTVTMTTSGSSIFVLRVLNAGSTVSNLHVDIPNQGTGSGGLLLSNGETAQGLSVTGPASPSPLQIGIQMGSSSVANSTVSVSTTSALGMYVSTNAAASVKDSTIVGARAIDLAVVAGQTATLSRNRLFGNFNGLLMYYGDVDLDNTLIDLLGGSGQAIRMDTVNLPGQLSNTIDASQLTIRNGNASSIGVQQQGGDMNATETLTLRDSIIRDIGHPFDQQAPASGSTYSVNADHNDYDQAASLGTPDGSTVIRNETNIVNLDPHFVSPVSGSGSIAGDYRLASDSPVIDIGSSTPLGAGETDLAGQPRIVDGVAPFDGALRDLGAYEYQLPQEQPPLTSGTPNAAGPTGQRAAALKKCKKKRTAKARRKCRKRAKRLPV